MIKIDVYIYNYSTFNIYIILVISNSLLRVLLNISKCFFDEPKEFKLLANDKVREIFFS